MAPASCSPVRDFIVAPRFLFQQLTPRRAAILPKPAVPSYVVDDTVENKADVDFDPGESEEEPEQSDDSDFEPSSSGGKRKRAATKKKKKPTKAAARRSGRKEADVGNDAGWAGW